MIFGCKNNQTPSSADPTFTPTPSSYSIAVMCPDIPCPGYTGKHINIYVDDDLNPYNGYKSMHDTSLTCGTYEYWHEYVQEGWYYVYGKVDNDSNTLVVNAGDLVGIHGGFWPNYPSDKTVDNTYGMDLNLRLSTATNNTSGTLTLPAAADGKDWYVILDTDDNIMNGGFIGMDQGTISGTGLTVNYNLCAWLPGTYYVYAFVDMDNSGFAGGYNSGDYYGIYSSTVTTAPNASNGPYNFTLTIIP